MALPNFISVPMAHFGSKKTNERLLPAVDNTTHQMIG